MSFDNTCESCGLDSLYLYDGLCGRCADMQDNPEFYEVSGSDDEFHDDIEEVHFCQTCNSEQTNFHGEWLCEVCGDVPF